MIFKKIYVILYNIGAWIMLIHAFFCFVFSNKKKQLRAYMPPAFTPFTSFCSLKKYRFFHVSRLLFERYARLQGYAVPLGITGKGKRYARLRPDGLRSV